MEREQQRHFMRGAIRHGSACVPAVGLVMVLATARAVSDDSAPFAPGEQSETPVETVAQEHDTADATLTSEASITAAEAAPLRACCIPTTSPSRTLGSAREVCVPLMSNADCFAAGGVPWRSCARRCATNLAPAGAEEEFEGPSLEMTDEAADSESSNALQVASAWTLLMATLFLAGL